MARSATLSCMLTRDLFGEVKFEKRQKGPGRRSTEKPGVAGAQPLRGESANCSRDRQNPPWERTREVGSKAAWGAGLYLAVQAMSWKSGCSASMKKP